MADELEHAKEELHRAEAELRKARAEESEALEKIERATEEIEEAEHRRVIHFKVDGEPCETEEHDLTPNRIIKEFGERDPATNYLVQLAGGQKTSYQGQGDQPIRMHDGMNFQIFSVGPMTVSYGS